MKLLILGSNSQLGLELASLLNTQEVDFDVLSMDEIDLSDESEVLKAIARINPTQVINVVAFSGMELAEEDPESSKQCDVLNTLVPAAVAQVCNTLNLPLIHHSSSYVFDGTNPHPYSEDEKTNPISRYGLSRWYGERAVQEVLKEAVILRTDWLFSVYRSRIFKFYIDACKKNKGKIDVSSHRFSPTPANDVARVILAISKQLDCNAEPWGIYHYCALQAINQEIFVDQFLHEASEYDEDLAAFMESLEITIVETKKPYIANSALSGKKLMETFGIKPRSRVAEVSAVLKDLYKPVLQSN